ncbi:hypothetical protein [Dickeya zeae]|uniref:hypothetical protein n=1 Tax=Dickeya zeae TaxID=204042 RepID=UPI000577276E|nr:hypothetical protein [Dickeya zeae]
MQTEVNYTSIIIAIIGWLIASYFNNRAFKRNDISRQKDKICQQIESLFEKIKEKISSRDTKELDLDNYLASSVSLIEMQLTHLSMRIGKKLLRDENLSNLRSAPLDCLTQKCDYKTMLNEMKYSILEEIECNYTNWFFNGCIQRLKNRFLIKK